MHQMLFSTKHLTIGKPSRKTSSKRSLTLVLRAMCLVLALGCAQLSSAQYSGGARSLALGGASVGQTGVEAVLANPAGMAFQSQTAFMLFGENRFGLADLKSVTAAAMIASDLGQFGIKTHYFGFEGFNRQLISLGYARKLFEQFSIGGQFDFIQTRISEYGSQSVLTFELGFHSRILKGLHWSGHLISPIQVELGETGELPTILRTGLTYEINQQLQVIGEVEKDIEFPIRLRAGIEYSFLQQMFFRVGIATEPSLLTFGLGYKRPKGFSIDLGVNYHANLGLSPGISLFYAIGKPS
ncbi:MAG: hypothetical protein AAF990_12740 [Bacteroidota bacterium]